MGEGSTSARDSGNGVTVEELSRRYHAVLLRYFARRGIGVQDAQDLAQDVFARLSRSHALDNVASAEGYLFATAANIALDFFRSRKVRNDHPAEGFVERIQVMGDFSPARLLEGRQELACIVTALNEMPERMRNIFILARLENLPRGEIAQRLGISKSLVEQQIALATACLSERRRRFG
ncbi:MAG: sigma-70 family RNA polymerase sigma factor [Sphingomonadales bacterium]|nr:MAG: sigma-70 family RNA polymerase sigma factor [Sphingomonadales bacterium]